MSPLTAAIPACASADPRLFFADDGESTSKRDWRVGRAQAICARCPLRAPCLDYALTEGIEHGTWGGMTEAGRVTLARRARIRAYRARLREVAA